MRNLNYKLIGTMLAVTTAGTIGIIAGSQAYAACVPTYGGGETCIFNKRFDIEKKVRTCSKSFYKEHKECGRDDNWKDKVSGLKAGDIIEFKVKIKNEGEIEVDDMKMKDSFPKQLEKLSGDGFTESWNDFEPGETKTFNFFAKVKDSEFDKKNFEKCVVNKAEVLFDEDEEGSDTATVCYSDKGVTELPKTGGSSEVIGALGLGSIALGAFVKKIKK